MHALTPRLDLHRMLSAFGKALPMWAASFLITNDSHAQASERRCPAVLQEEAEEVPARGTACPSGRHVSRPSCPLACCPASSEGVHIEVSVRAVVDCSAVNNEDTEGQGARAVCS